MKNQFLFAFILAFILGGCGFQLRGTNTQLSKRFQQTYLADDIISNTDFYRQIKDLITINGAKLVSREKAQIKIHAEPIKVSSRQIALSNTGALKEYEKTYQTVVTVTEMPSGIQLGSRVISTTRNVQQDERLVLVSEEESSISFSDATKELSQLVLLYLESF